MEQKSSAEVSADCYCVLPVFGPALQHTDYVIEYVKAVKNNKARNTAAFFDMYEMIADPAKLSDDDIWIIILDIIRNFDYCFANTYNNPLWKIFQDSTTVKKLTGFMLQHYKSSLATKMLNSCQLQPVHYVPTAAAMMLSRILSLAWEPVVVRLKRSKAAYFEPITVATFNVVSGAKCILPRKSNLDVWYIKREHENEIINKFQRISQPTVDWDKYKELIHNLSIFASQFYGKTLIFSGETPSNIDKLLCADAELDLSSLQSSLNELSTSSESYYPNDSVSDEEESNETVEEESDDEAVCDVKLKPTNKTQFDVKLYLLYHPDSNSSIAESHFRKLKRQSKQFN